MTVKRFLILSLVSVLLLSAPFSIIYAASDFSTFTINQYTVYEFFAKYGFRPMYLTSNNYNQNYNEYPVDDVITCIQYDSIGASGQDGYSCKLSNYEINSNNNKLFPVLQAVRNDSGVIENVKSKLINVTAYNSNIRIRVTKEPIYIMFFSNVNATNDTINIYPQNNNHDVHIERVTNDAQSLVAGTYYFITLKVWADSVPTTGTTKGYVFASVDFGWRNGGTGADFNVLPLYYGSKYTMPDDIYYYVFNEQKPADPVLTELIKDGTEESQDSVDLLDDVTGDLSDDFSQLSTIESGYNTDFNNQIQAINFSDQLSSQQGFLTSSNFVINVFNNLILNNPLTILIIIVSIFYVFRRFV